METKCQMKRLSTCLSRFISAIIEDDPPGDKEDESTASPEAALLDGKIYMKSYTRWLFATGLWSRSPEDRKCSFTFIVIVATYAFWFGISFLELYHDWGDLSTMTETMDMALIYSVTCHKYVNLMWGERDWRRVVRQVESNFNRPLQKATPSQLAVMKKRVRETRLSYLVWTSLLSGAIVSIGLIPLGDALSKRGGGGGGGGGGDLEANGTSPAGADGQPPSLWRIPFRTWTPFDNLTGFPYILVYAFHVFMAALQLFMIPAYDNLLIALVNYTCGQFATLQNSLLNIRRDAKERVQKQQRWTGYNLPLMGQEHGEEEDSEAGPALEAEMQRSVGEFVDFHETLLKFVRDIENMTNMVFLNQFFCTTVILCTSAFQITMDSNGAAKSFGMAYTLIAALYELSMFSYFANALIEESQGVGYSAYCSEWFHSSLSYRRSVTLVMVRSRRPCVLTYGKFAELSLESLAGILRISYTFFTVLNGVNE